MIFLCYPWSDTGIFTPKGHKGDVMKQIIRMGLIGLLSLCLTVTVGLNAWIDYGEKSEETRQVIYQVDKNYPPYTYIHQDYIHGFDPDLTNLVFNSKDYEVVYSYDTWDVVYERLVRGEIDLGGIIAVTEERKKEVLFSDILFNSYVAIYTKNDFERIEISDLSRLKIGVGKSYYTEGLLRDTLKIYNYEAYTDMNRAIEDLNSGRIDVIFENQQLMDNLLIELSLKGEISPQITNLYPRGHAYAISVKRADLVTYINNRIEKLKKSGVFEEVYMKYFYEHSDVYETQRRNTFMVVYFSIFIVIMMAFVGMRLYIKHLKRKLNANYLEISKAYEELMDANEELRMTEEELQEQYEEIQRQYRKIEKVNNDLEISEERYKLVSEGSNDCIWDWDIDQNIAFVSERWKNLIGAQTSYVENYYFTWMDSISEEDYDYVKTFIENLMYNDTQRFEIEYLLKSNKWIQTTGKVLRDTAGKAIRLAGSHTDITSRKNHDHTIYTMAYYDRLTGLPNRVMLSEYIASIFEDHYTKDEVVAILYIELDNFKHINDTLGHDFGDEVLKFVAFKLSEKLGSKAFVARHGGDEFFIVTRKMIQKEDIQEIIDDVGMIFNRLWPLKEHEIFLAASIGVVTIPYDCSSVGDVYKNIDAAMYEAKKSGKGTYRFFSKEMLKSLEDRTELENNLRKAIDNNEFELYYQPYFDANSENIVGAEALIRWIHPMVGIISPDKFIPVAEETGLIVPIGEWVIEEAVKAIKERQMDLPISINIAEKQLASKGFTEKLLNIIKKYDIEPKCVRLEITESSVMNNISENIKVLMDIKALGIKISLDDFGTGYSSLSYMQRLPIDILKIDKSFIDEINTLEDKKTIVGDIISIAHRLNMETIAEGVESINQVEYLRYNECDALQGYYFSKPMAKSAFETFIKEQK